MNLKKVKVALSMAVALVALPVMGQDLLADEAPIDRRMRAIDSVSLKSLINTELIEEGVTGLYTEWSNRAVNIYQNASLPMEFVVDLRGFAMPTTRSKVTSRFGMRGRRPHYGIDVKVYVGDTISSAFDGKVRLVKDQGRAGYGKYIVVRHNNGLETVYAHLSKYLVKENDVVKAGEPIGLGGNTGRSTGSHLHFETRLLGQPINPAFIFDFENQDIVAEHYVYRRGDKANSATLARSSSSSSTASASSGTKYYKVVKGDTAAAIAKKHGISLSKLYQLNKISARTILKPGQLLRCS